MKRYLQKQDKIEIEFPFFSFEEFSKRRQQVKNAVSLLVVSVQQNKKLIEKLNEVESLYNREIRNSQLNQREQIKINKSNQLTVVSTNKIVKNQRMQQEQISFSKHDQIQLDQFSQIHKINSSYNYYSVNNKIDRPFGQINNELNIKNKQKYQTIPSACILQNNPEENIKNYQKIENITKDFNPPQKINYQIVLIDTMSLTERSINNQGKINKIAQFITWKQQQKSYHQQVKFMNQQKKDQSVNTKSKDKKAFSLKKNHILQKIKHNQSLKRPNKLPIYPHNYHLISPKNLQVRNKLYRSNIKYTRQNRQNKRDNFQKFIRSNTLFYNYFTSQQIQLLYKQLKRSNISQEKWGYKALDALYRKISVGSKSK